MFDTANVLIWPWYGRRSRLKIKNQKIETIGVISNHTKNTKVNNLSWLRIKSKAVLNAHNKNIRPNNGFNEKIVKSAPSRN